MGIVNKFESEDPLWYATLANPVLREETLNKSITYTGEEARAKIEKLAAEELLFGEFHFSLFDPAYRFGDEIVRFALRHSELVRKYEKESQKSG